MSYTCYKCGTEAIKPSVCSGCGNTMSYSNPDVYFTIVTYRYGEVDRVIGPFDTVTEADMFWRDVGSTSGFVGVTYQVEIMSKPEAIKRGLRHD